jgi:hypothetical protein
MILAVPQLKDGIKVVCILTEAECPPPPLRRIRAHQKPAFCIVLEMLQAGDSDGALSLKRGFNKNLANGVKPFRRNHPITESSGI